MQLKKFMLLITIPVSFQYQYHLISYLYQIGYRKTARGNSKKDEWDAEDAYCIYIGGARQGFSHLMLTVFCPDGS